MLLLTLLACAPSASEFPKPSDDSGQSAEDTADTAASDTGATTDTSDTETDTVDTSEPTDTSDTSAPDDTADSGSEPSAYAGGMGPLAVDSREETVAGASVTWFEPKGAGPYPVVLWSHGFARNKANHVDAGEQLASWGFVVATPSLPNFSDHEANGEYLAYDLLPEAMAHPLAGTSVAFVGHSAGGLASLVAAALAGPDVYVGLDAVDMSSLGAGVDQDVTADALLLTGEPNSCNASGSGHGWALGGPQWTVAVTDASHCDFEFPSDALCTAFCGGEDETRRALALDYAVGFLVDRLGAGAADYQPGGAQAEADKRAGRISW